MHIFKISLYRLFNFCLFLGAVHYPAFSITWCPVNSTPFQSLLWPHLDHLVALSRDLFGLVRTPVLLSFFGKNVKRILSGKMLYHIQLMTGIIMLSVPSAVLNLSEGTVSETSIAVSWSRNPQSLQDKFQVSPLCIFEAE